MVRNIKIIASIVICRKHRTIFPRLFITADDKICIEVDKNCFVQSVCTVFTWYKLRGSSFYRTILLYDHGSALLRNPPFLAEPSPFCGLPPFYISANPLKFFRAERALGPTPTMLVGNK